MTTSSPLRAPTHYLRVDLNDPAEAEYWLLVLDATRSQIESAVAMVGRDARDVDRHLQSLRIRYGRDATQRSHRGD